MDSRITSKQTHFLYSGSINFTTLKKIGYNSKAVIFKTILTVIAFIAVQNLKAQTVCPCGTIVYNTPCNCISNYRDVDGDGFGDPNVEVSGTSNPMQGYVTNNTDCNDSDKTIYPGAPELCDGKDNNCNGIVDENIGLTTYYYDNDGDGFGNPDIISQATCPIPAGYVSNNKDCDDNNSAIQIRTWVKDADNDGYYFGLPQTQCTSPGEGYVIKTNQQDGDCDDSKPNQKILFVNKNATGLNNGSSWTNAYINLQDALALVYSCRTISEIWVAKGVYYPDEGTGQTDNDRYVHFSLKNNLAVYGGFNGNETSVSQRNWKLNETILSGDIDQNDGPGFNNNTGNSLNVIANNSINRSAKIDGFTITGGNANTPGNLYRGGGMMLENASPEIINCKFYRNSSYDGGAMHLGNSSPFVANCSFILNVAENPSPNLRSEGGAVYNIYLGHPVFNNCLFLSNSTSGEGGAITNYSGDVSLINCTITRNDSYYPACKGLYMLIGTCRIINCINTGYNGAIVANPSVATMDVTNSIIQGGFPGTGNLDTDPLFVEPTVGDFHLANNSPAKNAGNDEANNLPSDLDGNPRKNGVIDIGAYESVSPCITPTLWIIDNDDDNYYYGNTVSSCSSPGAGYKILATELPGDCMDSDPLINPSTLWYLDADGDGYGSNLYIPAPGGSCTPPQDGRHYINVNKGSDCDDNDATNNPETVWVYDKDGDGYYTGDPITGCQLISIEGLVKKTTQQPGDCNDNDAAAFNPTTLWYLDADSDGYGSNLYIPDPAGSCNPPQDGRHYIRVNKGSDCDDSDPTNNPETVWVIDNDGDGYYTGEPYTGCMFIQLPGYVKKVNQLPGDCDDANNTINPATLWYEDRDGDGYPGGDTEPGCERPKFYYGGFFSLTYTYGKLASELVSPIVTDCDDTDGNTNPGTTWYKDSDFDYYTDGTTLQSCERPLGYKKRAELSIYSETDCDDNNASINPGTAWYPDLDNDGYSTGLSSAIFNCTRPFGYKMERELSYFTGDCNDLDPLLNPLTLWVKDADNDGYAAAAPYVTQCSRPAGYKLRSELINFTADCNDANAAVNPASIWYKDADNDSYSDGATKVQCSQPTGYRLASELTALNGDCNDNDAGVHTPIRYYVDADKDGYGTNTSALFCSSTPPIGYAANNTDCNDKNAGIRGPQTFYRDADGDGYGDANLATSIQSCSQLKGYVTDKTDCDDTKATVKPGAIEICGNGIDDNCNGQVDENCVVCGNATALSTTNITSTSATLNWVAAVNPVQWQLQYKTSANNAKWIDVTLLAGSVRSITLTNLVSKQGYGWHIRAKCGTTWTGYSNTVSFTVLTSASLSKSNASPVVADQNNGKTAIRLHPNPTYGAFNLELQQPDLLATTAVVNIRDIAGRLVKSEKTGLAKGLLKTSMRLRASVTPGMYLVEVRINEEVYFAKLIYTK